MTSGRILHVIANLRHGGVQTWVMNLARQARRDGVAMDILTYSDQEWPLSAELAEIGVRVLACSRHRNPIKLYEALKSANQKFGPYDAIHAHEMYQNGAILLAAQMAGYKVRVSHAHNSAQAVRNTFLRRAYNRVMKTFISRSATHMLAVSELAGKTLYGGEWGGDARTGIAHCGLDFAPYAQDFDPAVRAELGIPANARVIGHAGRFVGQKNHALLVDVAAAVMKSDPDVWLVLVGDGGTRAEMERKAGELGIAERTVFTGARSDVPRLIVSTFDMLLLPSLFEGLGLIVLEALAAGKPCVISDVVPLEADVVPELVTRVSLAVGGETWAQAVAQALYRKTDARIAFQTVNESKFAIASSYRQMSGVYTSR
ncbi:glycosyltransferase [Novosphingobium guangzhouense]|uniref:Glycosyltransferase subfamily 4-like N-terminal domain-containing protein n=1 Tax=Novosphingobium guangzhouense TaxID=1850347 RepID=A0A2K2FZ79_9SPHN|nr:glycosyltransferase [Novosphingobium guangzhouense]PNU04062.1 hypothetical protein A8V01_05515 [Novosphingobium guangzhouense]